MATVNVFIRVSAKKEKKASVRFRLRDGRNVNLYYTSDLNVDPDLWDAAEGRLKERTNNLANKKYIKEDDAFNNSIGKVKTAILKAYFDESNKDTKTSVWLQSEVNNILNPVEVIEVPIVLDFFSYWDKYIKDANISSGRRKHVKVTRKKVKTFNPKTTFENIDAQYMTDFQNHMFKTVGRNTVATEFKRFKAFLNHAISHGWTTNARFKDFQVISEAYEDPIYITIEERDKLYNAEISEERLARVRDLFVFQCLIGCRVGDMLKLKKSNIINGSIQYIAGKTKDERPKVAVIPLTDKAKAILAKYNFENGDLLPYLSDQKYNEYVKLVFKHENVKLTRLVTVIDPKTRVSSQKRICDIVTTHMARRVFVGSLYQKGVKDSIIASMSGHTENSKAFSRYYKVNESDQQTAINLIQ